MSTADLRLVMMGTGSFAEPTFEAILRAGLNVVGLVTQPDRSIGAKRSSTRQIGRGMKSIAEEHGVAVFQPESINTPEGVQQLQAWQPDLLVVAAYGQILSDEVLATSTQGGINVHASLLPKYRGAAPVAWAIWHGEKQTGVTIIKMSVHLDAGDMFVRSTIDILPDETAGELETRLAPLGAELTLQVVDQIAAGTATGEKQDQTLETKAPKLKKHHGLIDWSRSSDEVCNHIRAMQPWPTPYTFLHQRGNKAIRVIVAKAKPIAATESNPPPGNVIVDDNCPDHIKVGTGAGGAVEIIEIQPAGKRRMPAAEFLRGHRLREGDFFGPEENTGR